MISLSFSRTLGPLAPALCPIGSYLSFDIKPLIDLDRSFSMGREHLPA